MLRRPGWSFSIAIHGPIEFYDVAANHLAEKLAAARFAVAISDFGRSQLMTITARERWRDLHVVHCGIDLRASPRAGSDAMEPVGDPIMCVGRLIALQGTVAAAAGVRRARATRSPRPRYARG